MSSQQLVLSSNNTEEGINSRLTKCQLDRYHNTAQAPLLDKEPQYHPPQHATAGLHPGPSSPARDIWWPSLETCSNLVTSETPTTNANRLYLVAVAAGRVGTSRQYAS